LAVVLLAAAPVSADEPRPFRWSGHHALAGHLSDAVVAAAIAADTAASWRSEHRGRAFGCQALRLGLVTGVTAVVKRTVHRTRPDGSDRMSFFSGHTATAMASAGWRLEVGVPIAVGAGYLRMAADKHYLTDVLAGAAAGWLVSRVCQP
jgi:membrane-associated phospholipid phosphatase